MKKILGIILCVFIAAVVVLMAGINKEGKKVTEKTNEEKVNERSVDESISLPITSSNEVNLSCYDMLFAFKGNVTINAGNGDESCYNWMEWMKETESVEFETVGFIGEVSIQNAIMNIDTYNTTFVAKEKHNMYFSLRVGTDIYGIEGYEVKKDDIFEYSIDEEENISFWFNGEPFDEVVVLKGALDEYVKQ